jgi:hypothetical protein
MRDADNFDDDNHANHESTKERKRESKPVKMAESSLSVFFVVSFLRSFVIRILVTAWPR